MPSKENINEDNKDKSNDKLSDGLIKKEQERIANEKKAKEKEIKVERKRQQEILDKQEKNRKEREIKVNKAVEKEEEKEKELRQKKLNLTFIGKKLGNGVITRVADKIINGISYVEVVDDKGVSTILSKRDLHKQI